MSFMETIFGCKHQWVKTQQIEYKDKLTTHNLGGYVLPRNPSDVVEVDCVKIVLTCSVCGDVKIVKG